ncbi:ComEC/Rec2 family competence protein [Spongiimicrobium sp. 3-5]|uniref:ComEC/Rec2 family competence protein n=1 Tax=Spongiimicrobium sp. 3-5 TaxID=3332596 RepID=UPI00397FAFD0
MQLLKFVPIKLTFFLVCGILIGHYSNFGVYGPLTFAITLLTLLGISLAREKRPFSSIFGMLTCFTAIAIGVLSISLSQPKNQENHYTHKASSGIHVWHVKIREVLKPTPFSDKYTAELMGFETQRVSGKILLNVKSDALKTKLKVDDELMVKTSLAVIAPPLNPHQFNYSAYMEGLGIYHQLNISNGTYFKFQNSRKTLFGFASILREKIILKLKQEHFGDQELSIIQALLLGQRNDISEVTYDNYKKAGAVHILALSGLHIGIILLLLQFFLSPIALFPHGRTLKMILIVVLLWAFALLAGMSASIVRAVTMFSFVAYAMYLNRPANTYNILALSMFFILLVIDPRLLFQVGFQMSYAAVFAIVWIFPLLQKFWSPKNYLLQRLWQLLSVSIAAQLGVLPISLFYFHQFPGLFFVSNLLVVPFLGIILGAGILVIVLSLLNSLPYFLTVAYNSLIYFMNTVIAWVARQELFILEAVSFNLTALVISYALIICVVRLCTQMTYKKAVTLLVVIMIAQCWAFYNTHQIRQKESLLIMHQSRNTVLAYRWGSDLKVFSSNPQLAKNVMENYRIGEYIDSLSYLPLKNGYSFANKQLFVVDSFMIYPPKELRPGHVLLTQSPKINLERLIDSVRPQGIIADGSNYRSHVRRWRKTCQKKKLPFHFTGERGAYYFE